MKAKHVVYVSDAKQADVVAVTLSSLLRHQKSLDGYVVHIVWAGRPFTDAERGLLTGVGRRYDFDRILFHDVNDRFAEYEDLIHGKMVWGRFFFAPFIDDATANVLYLDTDTLICDDLSELFSLDLGRNLLAAVSEAQFVTDEEKRDYVCRFLPGDCWRYFNAGVMLFNLKLFREERIDERVFDWYAKHRDVATCLDQDSMNAVAAGRVLYVHPKYNYNDGWLERQRRYSLANAYWRGCRPAEVLEAILHPAICHYVAGAKKPWKATHRPERKAYRACMRELGFTPPKDVPSALIYDVWHFVLKKIVTPYRLARIRWRNGSTGG